MASFPKEQQIVWKMRQWREAVPLSHSQVHDLISSGVIPSVKIGGARLITESPAAFIERHRKPEGK